MGGRGPAGVENDVQIVVGSPAVGYGRVLFDELLIARHGGGGRALADIDDLLEVRELGGKLSSLFNESFVYQQEASLAVRQGVVVFLHGPTDVQRRQNAPGPRHGKEGFDVGVGVHRQHGDRVAGFKS